MFGRRKTEDTQDEPAHEAAPKWDDLPLISTRSGKGRVLHVRGERGPRAEEVYSAGLIPAWGLEPKSVDTESVARVTFGVLLEVHQRDRKWQVLAQDGTRLGNLRWRAGDSGKPHAQTGVMIVYPERGTLRVERAVLDHGRVVDIGGTVHPVTE